MPATASASASSKVPGETEKGGCRPPFSVYCTLTTFVTPLFVPSLQRSRQELVHPNANGYAASGTKDVGSLNQPGSKVAFSVTVPTRLPGHEAEPLEPHAQPVD